MIDDTYLRMDFDSYLAAMREFTDRVLIAREDDLATAGRVPDDVLAQLATIGCFGISIPRAYGGLGWSMLEQIRLTQEFTRASLVYRSRFSPVIGLCAQAILGFGSDAQKGSLLPRMAAGELVMSFALTELEAGSDAANVQTVAHVSGDGFVLTGSKRYITNGAWADVLLVIAKVRDATGDRGLAGFLVDARQPGVKANAASRMNGHAEGPVADLEFTDVQVPRARMLGEIGDGLKLAMRGINGARSHVAAACVGQGERLISEMAGHADRRHQFGAPLAELGAVQTMIGASYAEWSAAKALSLDCGRAFTGDVVPRHAIAAAKLFASEMVGRVADRAVQVLGGEGIVGDSAVPRMWRDVRALRIYEGASQVHERNLARHVRTQVIDGNRF